MRKKIAIVDNSTWNIYNFRLSLIKRLKLEGYRVVVIAPVDEFIHYLNESYFTKHITLRHLAPQKKNPLNDLLLVWELFRIYRREKPDLILHYTIKPNIYGNLAAQLAQIPSISTITGLGYTFLHRGFVHKMVPHLYRMAFRQIQKLVFYNPDDKNHFIKQQLIDPKRGTVIPGSGVNTNHFRPLPQPYSEKFVFLFIGRLLYDKGLREFVEAARLARSITTRIECWVIGELNAQNPAAVSNEEMVGWIEEKHIRYFGVTKDVRKFIKKANVVVLPSYREGIPRSVLEGMAMAKPIITTDVAGCRETVTHGRNGYLVPAGDGRTLAETMLKMYHLSADQLESMGQYSRQKALEEFDDKYITGQYVRLIQSLLQEPEKASPLPAPENRINARAEIMDK